MLNSIPYLLEYHFGLFVVFTSKNIDISLKCTLCIMMQIICNVVFLVYLIQQISSHYFLIVLKLWQQEGEVIAT